MYKISFINNMKKVFIDSRAKSNINSENKKANEKPSILIEEEKIKIKI